MNEILAYDKISLLRLAFKGLEEDELQEIADLTELRTYPPDHTLCHEGENEEVFYIVADGSVVITKKTTEEAGERILRKLGRGALVGEMALIQNAPRAANVRTTTECTVLEMEKRDFETILSRSPRMAIDIIRTTLDRMRANDQMLIADLQKTNQILRQLDRNKLEFIQVAAHELRTPLTVLKGFVNVLGSQTGTNGDVIQGILRGIERIHEVVNLMLDVTRIDAETLNVGAVPVSVRHVIDELAKGFRKSAADRKVEIITEHAEDTPTIFGDPSLIQKALYQLIVNAIKYTPDGGKIILSTHPVVMEHEAPAVQIEVRDTGIGLDPEHHDLVFEKFYQVGSVALHSSGKTAFKGGGPGLGLAIVRGVTRAHGGRIWGERPGHDDEHFPGSTFYLQLPVQPPKRDNGKTG